MNELDRILSLDTDIEPTDGFSARVLEAIRAESAPRELPKSLITILLGLFVVLVGGPILLIVMEGSMTATGGAVSSRLLWILGLLVATSIAAVLPLQLLQD